MEFLRQDEVEWITEHNNDLTGYVFTRRVGEKREYYRVINPQKEQFIKKLFYSGIIQKMVSKAYLVDMWIRNNLVLQGYEKYLIIQSEYIPYVAKTNWYNVAMKNAAVKKMYEISLFLKDYNLDLCDVKYENLVFKCDRIMIADLGTICEDKGHNSIIDIYKRMEIDIMAYIDGNYSVFNKKFGEYGIGFNDYCRFFPNINNIRRKGFSAFLIFFEKIRHLKLISYNVYVSQRKKMYFNSIKRIERYGQSILIEARKNEKSGNDGYFSTIIECLSLINLDVKSALIFEQGIKITESLLECNSGITVCHASYNKFDSVNSYQIICNDYKGENVYEVLFDVKEKVERNWLYKNNFLSDLMVIAAQAVNEIIIEKHRRLMHLRHLIDAYGSKFACVQIFKRDLDRCKQIYKGMDDISTVFGKYKLIFSKEDESSITLLLDINV